MDSINHDQATNNAAQDSDSIVWLPCSQPPRQPMRPTTRRLAPLDPTNS